MVAYFDRRHRTKQIRPRDGVLIQAFGRTQIRLVTHLGISPEEVEKALEASRMVFR